MLPPGGKPVCVVLSGTPLLPGTLTLTGLRVTAMGGTQWFQPFHGGGDTRKVSDMRILEEVKRTRMGLVLFPSGEEVRVRSARGRRGGDSCKVSGGLVKTGNVTLLFVTRFSMQ